MVLPGPLGKLQSALLEGFKLRDGVGHLDLPLLTLLLQLLDLVLFTNLLVEVVLNRVLHENLQHHFLLPLLPQFVSFPQHLFHCLPLAHQFLVDLASLIQQLPPFLQHPVACVDAN